MLVLVAVSLREGMSDLRAQRRGKIVITSSYGERERAATAAEILPQPTAGVGITAREARA